MLPLFPVVPHVTEGAVSAVGDLQGSVRAVAVSPTEPAAALEFAYFGPAPQTTLLASGEARVQLGVMLNYQNECNLLYVMWRIAPTPGIVVQIKQNPGKLTHAECGADGYITVTPTRYLAPPPLPAAKTRHRLHAELKDARLTVLADGRISWQGAVNMLMLAERVGFRADNAILQVQLFAPYA